MSLPRRILAVVLAGAALLAGGLSVPQVSCAAPAASPSVAAPEAADDSSFVAVLIEAEAEGEEEEEARASRQVHQIATTSLGFGLGSPPAGRIEERVCGCTRPNRRALHPRGPPACG